MAKKKGSRGRNSRKRKPSGKPQPTPEPDDTEEIVGHLHSIVKGANRLTTTGIDLLDVAADFEHQEIEFGIACMDVMTALVDAGCPTVFKSTPREVPNRILEMWEKAKDAQWAEGDYEEEETESPDLETLPGGDSGDAGEGDDTHSGSQPVDPADGNEG